MSGSRNIPFRDLPQSFGGYLLQRRSRITGLILFTALAGFEAFNYSTTSHALSDLLGSLTFLGLRWSTILSIAFCGIDFAGIARIFTPEEEGEPSNGIWYLFAAWLLAATMNAALTWWGVSLALVNRSLLSSSFIEGKTLVVAAPILVAIVVWVTRILLISSLVVSGVRMPVQQPYASRRPSAAAYAARRSEQPLSALRREAPQPSPQPVRQTPGPIPGSIPLTKRPEPEYIPEYNYEPANALLEPAYHSLSAKSERESQRAKQA